MVHNILTTILNKRNTASVVILNLGKFEVLVGGNKVSPKDWKRDKSLQLLQYMIIACHHKALHKEQIIDRLWEDEMDDKSFKVALHGITKVIEPGKKTHGDSKFIERNGHTYRLLDEEIWIESVAFESLVNHGIALLDTQTLEAKEVLRHGIDLYSGSYLPDRIFEDWSADERERLQLLYVNACMALSELVLEENPSETIQLCQKVLLQDVTWEDAYRLQMEAFYLKGNRPMAIKTYQLCEKVLWEEMAIKPLPQTKKMYEKIVGDV